MNVGEWFQLLGIGMLAGALGQAIRVIVGLKKTSDSAAPGTALADNIDAARLLVSLLIGAVAGALAATTTLTAPGKLNSIAPEIFFGLMAAGYAGADFIEGFMSKTMPSIAGASGGSGSAAGGSAAGGGGAAAGGNAGSASGAGSAANANSDGAAG